MEHADFEPSVMKDAVLKGTELVKSAGHWKSAVTAYRASWTLKSAKNLQGLLDQECDGMIDEDFLELVREAIKGGVKARLHLIEGR